MSAYSLMLQYRRQIEAQERNEKAGLAEVVAYTIISAFIQELSTHHSHTKGCKQLKEKLRALKPITTPDIPRNTIESAKAVIEAFFQVAQERIKAGSKSDIYAYAAEIKETLRACEANPTNTTNFYHFRKELLKMALRFTNAPIPHNTKEKSNVSVLIDLLDPSFHHVLHHPHTLTDPDMELLVPAMMAFIESTSGYKIAAEIESQKEAISSGDKLSVVQFRSFLDEIDRTEMLEEQKEESKLALLSLCFANDESETEIFNVPQDLRLQSARGRSLFMLAVQCNPNVSIQYLRDRLGLSTPLDLEEMDNDKKTIFHLVKNENQLRSLLDMAIPQRVATSAASASEDTPRSIPLLFEKNLLNQEDAQGFTPIMRAIQQKNEPVKKMLLLAGAHFPTKDQYRKKFPKTEWHLFAARDYNSEFFYVNDENSHRLSPLHFSNDIACRLSRKITRACKDYTKSIEQRYDYTESDFFKSSMKAIDNSPALSVGTIALSFPVLFFGTAFTLGLLPASIIAYHLGIAARNRLQITHAKSFITARALQAFLRVIADISQHTENQNLFTQATQSFLECLIDNFIQASDKWANGDPDKGEEVSMTVLLCRELINDSHWHLSHENSEFPQMTKEEYAPLLREALITGEWPQTFHDTFAPAHAALQRIENWYGIKKKASGTETLPEFFVSSKAKLAENLAKCPQEPSEFNQETAKGIFTNRPLSLMERQFVFHETFLPTPQAVRNQLGHTLDEALAAAVLLQVPEAISELVAYSHTHSLPLNPNLSLAGHKPLTYFAIDHEDFQTLNALLKAGADKPTDSKNPNINWVIRSHCIPEGVEYPFTARLNNELKGRLPDLCPTWLKTLHENLSKTLHPYHQSHQKITKSLKAALNFLNYLAEIALELFKPETDPALRAIVLENLHIQLSCLVLQSGQHLGIRSKSLLNVLAEQYGYYLRFSPTTGIAEAPRENIARGICLLALEDAPQTSQAERLLEISRLLQASTLKPGSEETNPTQNLSDDNVKALLSAFVKYLWNSKPTSMHFFIFSSLMNDSRLDENVRQSMDVQRHLLNFILSTYKKHGGADQALNELINAVALTDDTARIFIDRLNQANPSPSDISAYRREKMPKLLSLRHERNTNWDHRAYRLNQVLGLNPDTKIGGSDAWFFFSMAHLLDFNGIPRYRQINAPAKYIQAIAPDLGLFNLTELREKPELRDAQIRLDQLWQENREKLLKALHTDQFITTPYGYADQEKDSDEQKEFNRLCRLQDMVRTLMHEPAAHIEKLPQNMRVCVEILRGPKRQNSTEPYHGLNLKRVEAVRLGIQFLENLGTLSASESKADEASPEQIEVSTWIRHIANNRPKGLQKVQGLEDLSERLDTLRGATPEMVIACFVGTACERLHKAKAAAPNGAASSSEITSTAANAVENALVWAGELVSQGRNHKALYHLAPTLMGTLTKDVVERFKAAAKQCLGDELFASLEATPHVIDATGGGAEEAIELRDFRQGQHLEEGAAAASDDLEETLNPFGAR